MALQTRIEELSIEECYALLESHSGQVGRVAVAGARPVIFPVNYVMDGRNPVFRTAPGTHFAETVAGAFVAFEVDEVHAAWRGGWSVLVRGKADVVDGETELARLVTLDLHPWAPGDRDLYVRIRTDIVTGRRIADA